MKYKIAFASTGEYIDQHFGSARYFQVYEIDGDEHNHIETRVTNAYCKGSCEGGFDHLLEALKDCDAVFVSKIGQNAAVFMIGHGVRVFEAAGEVEEIIAELIQGNMLDEIVEIG